MREAYSPVPELNLLKRSDDRLGKDFSAGFELRDFGYDAGLIEWLDLEDPKDPELQGFLDRLIPFAQAADSGSFYALRRSGRPRRPAGRSLRRRGRSHRRRT